MMRVSLGTAALVLALFAFAAPASAQLPVQFSISGGPSLPQGELGEELGTGFHVQGSVGLALPTMPFTLRTDLMYQRIPEPGHGNLRLLVGNVNAVRLLGMGPVRPYLIAGAGLYNEAFQDDYEDHDHEGSHTNFGVNGGLGLQFNLLAARAFIETRMHNVFEEGESIRILPITIGIGF